ncbi:hypothetical protein SHIRM173S_10814 [Streptomyces hirsutus]
MRVAGDEQVVGAGEHGGAQHAPLRGVQVLCLVDDDVGVRGRLAGEEFRRAGADPQVCGFAAVAQELLEPLHAAPHLSAARGTETGAAAPAARTEVGVEIAQVLAEHDVPVLLGQEPVGEGQTELLDCLLPQLPLFPVPDRFGRGRRLRAYDAVRVGVDRRHVDSRQQLLVLVDEQAEHLAQSGGERVRVRGEQDAAVLGTAEQVLDPVQGGHRLARPGSAGDLDGTPVRGAVGDAPLGGMEEDPPGRERLLQDLLQLLRPGDQADACGSVGDHRGQVLDRLGGRVGGSADRHHVPVDLLRAETLGEVLQHLQLILRQERGERIQLCLVHQGTRGAQHLVVDAELAQRAVGDVREQQARSRARCRLVQRCQLVQGDGVAHLQGPRRGVRAVQALRRPGVGVVVRQDVDQEEHVAAVVRGEDDAPPEVGDAYGAHPRVTSVLHGLQVQSLVRVQFGDAHGLELRHGLAYSGSDRLLQGVVSVPEALGEGEPGHEGPSFPPDGLS